MLPRCPICKGEMIVTELRCEEDDITVRGRFKPSVFDFLDEDEFEFIILFLRARGNLKELERYTKQGYFALRGKLERILEKLKLEPLGKKEEVKKEDVFKLVKEGKIDVDTALEILKKGGDEDEV